MREYIVAAAIQQGLRFVDSGKQLVTIETGTLSSSEQNSLWGYHGALVFEGDMNAYTLFAPSGEGHRIRLRTREVGTGRKRSRLES